MNLKYFFAISLISFTLQSCIFSNGINYENMQAAKADRLFEKGWLPEILPTSTVDIKTDNDLDLNMSEGEFRIPIKDLDLFISKLEPYKNIKSPLRNFKDIVTEKTEKDYLSYSFFDDGSTWVFFINKEQGHIYYYLWLKR